MAASLQGDTKSMINTSFSQQVYLFHAEGQDIVFYIASDPCAGHLIKVLLCFCVSRDCTFFFIGAHLSLDAFVQENWWKGSDAAEASWFRFGWVAFFFSASQASLTVAVFFFNFFPSRASHFLLYSPTSQKDCFEDGEQSSIFWMFSLSGILNPVLHYGGSTLWVIEDATSSSLFRFNTDDKQFVIGVTFCSRSMITRAGKSDFPALMMTIKLEIDDNCFWRKACWPASPMKTCFIWMKSLGKLN